MGLRYGCYEELAAVELGDVGGGVKEAARFGCRENIGNGGGVEAVGAEKLEESDE